MDTAKRARPPNRQAIVRREPPVDNEVARVDDHAPGRHETLKVDRRQRLGHDQKCADRDHAPADPAERANLGNAARQQDLSRDDFAPWGLYFMPGWDLAHGHDGSPFIDLGATPCGGGRQAPDEPADMHAGTLGKEQAAIVAVGADFGSQVGARDHPRFGIDIGRQEFLAARQHLVVLGLGGKLELADTGEAAVDLFFLHQPLDHVDARVESLVERIGGRLAVLASHDCIVLCKTVVAHPAIAAGRGVADRFGFQQGNPGASFREGQRRGGSSQAAAHDRHIVVAFERFGRPIIERLRRIQPVRGKLHS